MLRVSRCIAALFAIGLAIGEAILNWGHWQFWPLWVVDYVIVIWLLVGVWLARRHEASHHLTIAWAFTAGIFYMALFGGLDELRGVPGAVAENAILLSLISLMFALSLLGLGCSIAGSRAGQKISGPQNAG
jgi:hypothetical protein